MSKRLIGVYASYAGILLLHMEILWVTTGIFGTNIGSFISVISFCICVFIVSNANDKSRKDEEFFDDE
jgi:hypothetical protein